MTRRAPPARPAHAAPLLARLLASAPPPVTTSSRARPWSPAAGHDTRGMSELEIYPRGPFSLAAARDFAGGFPAGIGGGGVGAGSITLSFWVEGFDESAAIELWQDDDGVVRGRSDA